MSFTHRFLGLNPKTPDHRDLLLKNYIDAKTLIDAAQVPGALDWGAFPTPTGPLPEADEDPLYNDKASCCVLAAPGHHVKLVGQLTGAPMIVTAGMVRDAYAAATGYDPATGANDNGWIIRDMLKQWRSKGLYGTTLAGFCAVDWTDADEVAIAAWLCGGLIGGYALPVRIREQDPDWSVPEALTKDDEPGSLGGHCIYQHGASPGLDEANSWGEHTTWTPAWRRKYCSELWAPVLGSWVMKSGRAPNGFAFSDLLADVQARAQG
jgi:hypothetical protein